MSSNSPEAKDAIEEEEEEEYNEDENDQFDSEEVPDGMDLETFKQLSKQHNKNLSGYSQPQSPQMGVFASPKSTSSTRSNKNLSLNPNSSNKGSNLSNHNRLSSNKLNAINNSQKHMKNMSLDNDDLSSVDSDANLIYVPSGATLNNKEVNDLMEKLKIHKKEIKILQKQNRDLNNDLKTSKAQYEKQIAKMKSQVEHAENIKKDLEQSHQDVKAKNERCIKKKVKMENLIVI